MHSTCEVASKKCSFSLGFRGGKNYDLRDKCNWIDYEVVEASCEWELKADLDELLNWVMVARATKD